MKIFLLRGGRWLLLREEAHPSRYCGLKREPGNGLRQGAGKRVEPGGGVNEESLNKRSFVPRLHFLSKVLAWLGRISCS
jgi:hypothetical protein